MSTLLRDAKKTWPQISWEVFLTPFSKTWGTNATLTLLSGGFSQDFLFRIDLEQISFVLRFFHKNHSPEDCINTVSASCWAGENQLGPKVHLFDPKGSFFMMDFLPGKHMSLSSFKEPAMICLLATTMAKIHRTLPPKHVRIGCHFTTGQRWIVQTRKEKVPLPKGYEEAYLLWEDWHHRHPSYQEKHVMLHSDFSHRNIFLRDKRFTMVDWEFAGLDDPKREIARTIAWYGWKAPEIRIFLEAYLQKEPSPHEISLLKDLYKMIHAEIAWLTLSRAGPLNHTENEWEHLYANTPPISFHEFVTEYDTIQDPDNFPDLSVLSIGFLKFYLKSLGINPK